MLDFADIWLVIISFLSWLLNSTRIMKKISPIALGPTASLCCSPTPSPSPPCSLPPVTKAAAPPSPPASWRDRPNVSDHNGVKLAGAFDKKRPASLIIPAPHTNPLSSGEFCGWEGHEDKLVEVQGYRFAVICKKGRRRIMEDNYGVITDISGDPKQAFFGVFDGHGGRGAVDFVTERLGKSIVSATENMESEDENSFEIAIRHCYMTTDREFLSQGMSGGACVATVLVNNSNLHIANAGDCRVVLGRNGAAFPLTRDHRPNVDDERVRIENSGGYVDCINGVWRVQGSLAVSRAIGDIRFKEWVICEPEIHKIKLSSDCDFLIMASDGLWDKVSNQEAVDEVMKHKNTLESCRRLVDMSSYRGNKDDITIMIIDLKKFLQY